MPHMENLLKMADWLETQCPQEQFDMNHFMSKYPLDAASLGMDTALTSCNTVGCVIGSIPKVFGIFPKSASSDRAFDFDWVGLGYRVFDVFYGNHWDWMFAGEWKYIDNTPIGAAKRIRYFVEHGREPVWYDTEEVEDLYRIADSMAPIEEVVPWIWQYRTEVLGQPIPAPMPEE